MKILKKGPGWNIEWACTGKGNGGGGCESLLLIEEGDLYVTANTDMHGDTTHYTTFKCINCGCETDIPNNQIPQRVQTKISNAYRRKNRRD